MVYVPLTSRFLPVFCRITQGMEWRVVDRGVGGICDYRVFPGRGGGSGVGGVIGGVGVVCGDAVDSGVGGVVCGVVCEFVCGFVCGVALISMMIVSVLEKDRWFGTRGRIVQWKGVRVTKASKRAKMGVRGWLDTSNVRFEGYRYKMKGEKLL
nr:hypothetical protein [Tanacetum cinerariifolium]